MLEKNKINRKFINNLMFKMKKKNQRAFWCSNINKCLIFLLYKIKFYPKFLANHINYEIKGINKNVNYFSNERIAIYTVIFGKYDQIIEPNLISDNCDFFIITDNDLNIDTKFKIIKVNLEKYDLDQKNNIEKNRFFKMHPHLLFEKYKYSLYIDGNISIISDPTEFIHNINSYGLAMHSHFRSKCVYDEIKVCKDSNKDLRMNLEKHERYLVNVRMPKNYGMLEAPIILREHNNPQCIKIMREWWAEFQKYSKRDQISLPHVLWQNNIRIEEISTLGNDIYSNYSFKKRAHVIND